MAKTPSTSAATRVVPSTCMGAAPRVSLCSVNALPPPRYHAIREEEISAFQPISKSTRKSCDE
jgi:hypothetical protein